MIDDSSQVTCVIFFVFIVTFMLYINRYTKSLHRRGPFGCKIRDNDAVCHSSLRRRAFLAHGRVFLSFAQLSERVIRIFGARAWFRGFACDSLPNNLLVESSVFIDRQLSPFLRTNKSFPHKTRNPCHMFQNCRS